MIEIELKLLTGNHHSSLTGADQLVTFLGSISYEQIPLLNSIDLISLSIAWNVDIVGEYLMQEKLPKRFNFSLRMANLKDMDVGKSIELEGVDVFAVDLDLFKDRLPH